MLLINLLVALIAGLILFEPFTRAPVSRSVRFTGHRNRAKRAFLQAAAALFAALIIATSEPSPQHVSPILVLSSSALLTLAGMYWAWRGTRLLKPRKMFSTR